MLPEVDVVEAGSSQQDQQLLGFLPYWTLDPPEESSLLPTGPYDPPEKGPPSTVGAEGDVEDSVPQLNEAVDVGLVVLDADPLF